MMIVDSRELSTKAETII